MQKLYALVGSLLVALFTYAQTSPAAQNLPYTQDFATLAHASTTYPAGWQGWTIANSPSGSFSTASPIGDRGLGASATAASTSAGVYNYNGKIGFQNTGSADLSIVLAINTSGYTNVQVSYDIMTIRNQQDGSSNTRINETVLQYRVGTAGTFTTLGGTEYQNNNTNQTSGTTPLNPQPRSVTLPSVCNNQPVVQLRWISRQVSGMGGRPSFAVDNVSINGSAGGDFTAPSVTALSPANGATNVPQQGVTATITFDETIQKGSGNITLRKASDNTIVGSAIDVSSSAVTITGTTASFLLPTLQAGTSYYITIDAGAVKDASNNNFGGITNNTTWAFTISNALIAYNFSNCTSALSDGFIQQNVVGTEVWSCTTFGRNGNGVQMNGFNSTTQTNQANEDWLISPPLDLSTTTYPILSFYSRSRFAGDALRLYITSSYTGDVITTGWTELNGFFPAANSDVWTLSDNIDLSAYKQSSVRIAFRYTSSTSAASRWTLDDVTITNSPTPPAVIFNVNTKVVDFREVTLGNSGTKSFNFSAINLSSTLTVTSPSVEFELSRDNTTFSSTVNFTAAEAQTPNTVYVKFTPSSGSATFGGFLNFSATGFDRQGVYAKGNSQSSTTTLNVVNWNIEWFGSSSQDPSDDNLQQANAKKVMDILDADVYALAEIVDVPRLGSLVNSLNNAYSFVIAEHCTGGSTAAACATNQKTALVYKQSALSNVSGRAINLNGVNWANGRVPYLVTGNATKNGQTTTIHFIVIHAKANTGDDQAKVDSYLERRAGIKELKDTLDTYFANSNIILLGDFNDDLDRTIAPTTGPDTVSSYQLLISDSTDGNSYRSLTLPLSNLGLASTTTFPDVIDHVVVSNEMALRYLNLSSSIYNDIETIASITNFDGTTSDHYPVMTRFQFGGTLPITLASFNATKESNTVKLNWATSQELNTKEFAIEHSADGRKFEVITNVPARGNGSVTTTYQAIHQRPLAGNNFYRLKSIDSDGKASFSGVVKINFSKNFTISLTPNPASQYVTINLSNNREALQMQIVDMNGKVMKSSVLASHVNRISLAGLGKGLYLVKVQGVGEAYTEKLLVQ